MSPGIPPVCILAGGLATRLGDVAAKTPKALLDVAGEPFVIHQLRLLAYHGAQEVTICIGHLGNQVVERIGEKRFGIRVTYSDDGPRPLGTLGAIRKAVPLLGERFLVLYGDTYLRFNYREAVTAWKQSGLPAMMTVLHNNGRWEASNTSFDGALITAHDKRFPKQDMQWIDYGLGGLSLEALSGINATPCDLSDLYQTLACRGQLFGFETTERFYEIGTHAGLRETREFLAREGGRARPAPYAGSRSLAGEREERA